MTTATKQESARHAREACAVARGERATLRAEIKRGGHRDGAGVLADALEDRRSTLDGVFVWQLLQWVPLVKDTRTEALLRASGIDPFKKVGRLSDGQRAALVRQLRALCSGVPVLVCRSCEAELLQPALNGLCGFCDLERKGAR